MRQCFSFLFLTLKLLLISVPVGSSGLYLDPARTYRYSYEAEVVLNEADLTDKDKEYRIHADVGKY